MMNSIGARLFVIIGIIFLVFSSFFLYRTYEVSNQYVYKTVETHAEMALQFDLSIRKYVAEKIRPIMYDLVGEEEFIPESMSTSFVARSIFEDVQQHFPDYILKFSSDDPRNPANQAGKEELDFIRYFNDNPGEKSWSGTVQLDSKQYYARFNARRMKESCLRCHGKPTDAPKSLLERYGSNAGFYRPVGEVIALDTIAIPITSIQQQLWREISENFIILGGGLILLFTALYISVHFFITNRLKKITDHLAEVSNQSDYAHISPLTEDRYNDEITILAKSYNTLIRDLKKYHNARDEEVRVRKKAENKLRQSKTTLENVLDSAGPICITSTDYEIVQANRAYYEIWPERNGKDIKCYESRPGTHCTTDLCPLKQIMSGNETVTVDVTKYTRNNEPHEFIVTARPFLDSEGKLIGIVESFLDITKRKILEDEKADLIEKLQSSLEKVKLLSGFLPICASCKKVKDDKGYWSQIESYIRDHSEAEFSHSLCPDCLKEYYKELDDFKNNSKGK